MDNHQEIINQLNEDDKELVYQPKQRKKTLEPVTRYDFCQVIGKIIGQPTLAILKRTKHYPMDWFYQLQAEVKNIKSNPSIKDPLAVVKYVSWFLRESKARDD